MPLPLRELYAATLVDDGSRFVQCCEQAAFQSSYETEVRKLQICEHYTMLELLNCVEPSRADPSKQPVASNLFLAGRDHTFVVVVVVAVVVVVVVRVTAVPHRKKSQICARLQLSR